MKHINKLKKAIAVDVQYIIDGLLEVIKADLTSVEFDPALICARLERVEEEISMLKEKAYDLDDLLENANE